MTERGVPYHISAYAMGKMLNNSEWLKGERVLPRRITPSDVDLVFDNAGAVLLCELSRHDENWLDLDFGQRTTYENLIIGSRDCAVLCKHEVDWRSNKHIDTRADITKFQPMICRDGQIVYCELVRGNNRWQNFIFSWFADPFGVWRYLEKEFA